MNTGDVRVSLFRSEKGSFFGSYLSYVMVFLIYLLATKIGLYLFYNLHTSPAIIWSPVGVGVAAMYLGGYRMWIPLALASLAASIGTDASLPIILVSVFAYTLQQVASTHIMRRFQFQGTFEKGVDALVLILVAFILSAIGPILMTAASALVGNVSIFYVLGRSWAGGIFSIVVLVPFITTWYPVRVSASARSEKLEILAALLTIVVVDLFIFWTPYAVDLGIAVIFILPMALMWFVLRLRPRWFTLAILLTAIVGITGSIVTQAHMASLPLQLLSDEVYIGFIAAIFLVFTTIVEERRVAYRSIERNNVMLEEALLKISSEDNAKTEFIAILAHELRNPLAPIVSAHEWLETQVQGEESIVAIKSAQQHTLMIQRLLDDLLEMARVSQKTFRLQKEVVNIRDVVRQSVESTVRFLQSRNHTLTVTMPEEELFLFADPIRVTQILINLLNNAGKYTEPGGAIELFGARAGGLVSIGIRDNGMGIEPDVLPTIFSPFRRIGPTPHSGTGLGIGLSLTKRLVEMHGGRIEAKSAGPGQGSTFTVYLPITEERPPAKEAVPQVVPAVPRRARVLVVDDNEAAARGLEKLLMHHGQEVRTVFTGAGALDLVSTFEPDMTLLDIGLPDMDGYQVIRALRASGWHGTVVALTGYGQESDRMETKDAGFDHHLVKPVSVSTILDLLKDTPPRDQ